MDHHICYLVFKQKLYKNFITYLGLISSIKDIVSLFFTENFLKCMTKLPQTTKSKFIFYKGLDFWCLGQYQNSLKMVIPKA